MNVPVNATLTAIAAPGPLGPSGDPGTPVTVWQGRAKGYLKRIRRQVVSGGQSVDLKRDIFTLLNSEGAPVIEQAGADWEGSTVVIADERTPTLQERRYVVRGMENRAAGTPADSIRLELAEEAVA
jgi:hypothetical protein